MEAKPGAEVSGRVGCLVRRETEAGGVPVPG
jgi:hypothetical protein